MLGARQCTRARAHTRTPPAPPRNLGSGDGTRQEGGTWPERRHRLQSPPSWLSVPQFPHLWLGCPSPAPRPNTPCTPKAPTVALPRSIPIPPAPSRCPLAEPWSHGTGSCGPCSSTAHQHPPGSRSSPESPLPAGPGLWWHLDQGHPALGHPKPPRKPVPRTVLSSR